MERSAIREQPRDVRSRIPLSLHAGYGSAAELRAASVIASEAKQSRAARGRVWIASALRASQ